MILGLSPYFILMNFYIFSIFGWIYESTFVSVRDKKPVNRGFLIGPILPLYGTGATLVYIILRPTAAHPSLLYACGMIIATVIEYFTAVILEKLFHAKWWDYSNEPYNFQGRIALIPSLFWGFLSLFLFDVLEPLAIKLISMIPVKIGEYLLTVLVAITLIDLSYTVITTINFSKQLETLYNFRNEIENQLQDIRFKSLRETIAAKTPNFATKIDNIYQKLNTLKESSETGAKATQLEERLKHYLEKHSSFLKKHPFTGNRRILNAFPTMKFISKNRTVVDVKEFFNNFNIKTGHSKGKE